MADEKISGFTADTNPSTDDLIPTVNDPGGTPANRQITIASLFGLLYPVGSIYISTLSTNPGTLLGVGTWTAFGAGKTLVSLDSGDTDFDTVEETGGAKTHTHTLSDSGWAQVSPPATGPALRGIDITGSEYTSNFIYNASRSSDSASRNTAAALDGNTDSESSLQPYIVVYMWKRTA